MKLRQLFRALAANLPDMITVTVAAIVLILLQTTVDPDAQSKLFMNATLGLLTLLAISGLVDRSFRLGRIEQQLQIIANRDASTPTAERFFTAEAPSPEFIGDAESVDICGILLTTTTRRLMNPLIDLVSQGNKLARVMLIDPRCQHVKLSMVSRSPGDTDAPFWADKLEKTINLLSIVANAAHQQSNFRIRYLSFVPGFGLTIVKRTDGSAKCYVELYHALSGASNAAFVIDRHDDPKWFSFFSQQYELMWDSARNEDWKSIERQ